MRKALVEAPAEVLDLVLEEAVLPHLVQVEQELQRPLQLEVSQGSTPDKSSDALPRQSHQLGRLLWRSAYGSAFATGSTQTRGLSSTTSGDFGVGRRGGGADPTSLRELKMRRLGAACLLWSCASTAFAMCPHPTPKVCSSYFESDAVFVATVLSSTWGDEDIRFQVKVTRVLRGSVGATAVVYSGNDSGRLQWQVGKTYVAFARQENGRLESGDDCGPLSDAAKVSDVVRQIEGLREAKGAVVEGQILPQAGSGPVADLAIVVESGQRRYRGRPDAKGLFRISVPAGHFRVTFDPARAYQSDYNLGTDLQDLSLADGQCAQVELVAR